MKRFFVQLTIEYTALLSAAVTAALLVRGGHPALGLTVIALYGAVNLVRLMLDKIDAEYTEETKVAQLRNLKERLQLEKARKRQLELALLDAVAETLWISKVTEDGVYIVEIPDHGCFVIIGEEETDDAKTEDAPAAPEEG